MNLEKLKEIINQYRDRIIIHKNESYSGHLQSNIQLFKEINNKCPNLFHNITEIVYLIKNYDNLENLHIFCYCGNKNTFVGLKAGYLKFCSNKCANNSPEVKEKYENTLLQRYGVKQLAKTDFMQKKFKDPEWGKRCRHKQIETFQKRTGYRHPLICPESKQKFENTMMQRYNVRHHWCSKDPKLNGQQTRLELYGYVNSFQIPENKQKAILARKNTNWLEKVMQTREKHKKEIFERNNKHIHFEDYNEEFFRTNFIKNNKFDLKACCEYFKIYPTWANKKKRDFNITEPNIIQHQFKEQSQVYDYIKLIYNGNILFNTKNIIKPLELDIYIPEKNVAIEFNGLYWHSINSGIDKYYHQLKSFKCKEKGIRLIHIYEDEWLNENKQKIIKDIIKHALNIKNSNENKIYARKCIIKEIDNDLYNEFCNNNHIQGSRGAQVKLGLFYNDELVQIASFGKSRFNKYIQWEWIRGCPASNNNVIGGTSKLFSYFIKNYKPKSVLCYADFNKFDGKGYKECGFEFQGFTSPNKFYFDLENHKRLERSPSKYKEYMQNVKNGKFLLLYGAGNLRFIYKNKI